MSIAVPFGQGIMAAFRLSRFTLLAATLLVLAVSFSSDSRPAAAQQSPSLPPVTAVAADARRAADAAETSAEEARLAATAADALADSHPAAAADANAAEKAADLSDTSSKLSRFHAEIAADHITFGSDHHCHQRVNVCHSHLDSEPYARSAEAARSAADAHAHAAAAHAAHARAALKAEEITAETEECVAKSAESVEAYADATGEAADAAWDAVHREDDAQASAWYADHAHAYATKAADVRARTAALIRDGDIEVCVSEEPPPPLPPPPPPPTRDDPPPPNPDPPRNNNGGGGGGGGGGSRARSTPTPVPNNPPEFEEGAIVTVSVRENSPAGTEVGDPITATDPEGDDVRYELGGRDAELFDIDEDTGQITVAEGATLDYETDKLHHVTVTAEDIDGSGEQATIDVNINITDDERLPGKADNYDENGDGALDLSEVLAAIKDYFDGLLIQEEVLAIINAYLDSGS